MKPGMQSLTKLLNSVRELQVYTLLLSSNSLNPIAPFLIDHSSISLAQEKIKSQNLEFGFYWIHIAFTPSWSWKIVRWTIVSHGPSVFVLPKKEEIKLYYSTYALPLACSYSSLSAIRMLCEVSWEGCASTWRETFIHPSSVWCSFVWYRKSSMWLIL